VPFALAGPGGVSELGVGVGQPAHDGVQEGRLVRLDEQEVVRAEVLADLPGGFPLPVQRVGRDDHAVQVQSFQHGEEFRDLVRLRVCLALGHDAALGDVIGGQQVNLAAVGADAPRAVLPSAAACGSRPGTPGCRATASARRCSRSCRATSGSSPGAAGGMTSRKP
jgi:hypothetical protein